MAWRVDVGPRAERALKKLVSDTVVSRPRRGVTYEIDVSGVGFTSGATFVVGDRDGRIGHG